VAVAPWRNYLRTWSAMHWPASTHEYQSSGKTLARKVRAVLSSILSFNLTLAVLGTNTRMFKHVFEAANSQLMDVFGMQMVELPSREKVTVRQKRGEFFSHGGVQDASKT
jgi:hypothetical protein